MTKFCNFIPNDLSINSFTTQSRLLTTLWEKERMLVTSIFSFSHNVFYPSQQRFLPYQRERNNLFSEFILSSAHAFNLDQSKILPFGRVKSQNTFIKFIPRSN